jgi:hypothetical protein
MFKMSERTAAGAGPLGPFIPVPIDEAPSVMPMMGGPGRGMRPQGGPMNYYGGGGRGRRGPMAGPLAMTAGRCWIPRLLLRLPDSTDIEPLRSY